MKDPGYKTLMHMTENLIIPIIERAALHAPRIAIADGTGEYTYDSLLEASEKIAGALLSHVDRKDLGGERIAYIVPPGFEYVATQWGIWRAGGVAVPLCISHPPAELDHVIKDSDPLIVVADRQFYEMVEGVLNGTSRLLIPIPKEPINLCGFTLPDSGSDRNAMILYTSGTTGAPKGVVLTHDNISAQITNLIDAWEWSSDDVILNILPLHHLHGIVNILCCALWAGAKCEFPTQFRAGDVWDRFKAGGVTLFMAVPTVYVQLIKHWRQVSANEQALLTESCRAIRLMVSGSAPLSTTVSEEWAQITGHRLLERYGMTEIGMALSHSLHGQRRTGCVGSAITGVKVRLVDESGNVLDGDRIAGEIQVRGATVFAQYWQDPKATNSAFHEKWFRTGDIAMIENGDYKILGRSSIDIIKTGGYKVSAIEIECVMKSHPKIADCAVVGIADEMWGERVGIAVVSESGPDLLVDNLRDWARDKLANYKLPSRFVTTDSLPRNAMGKVIKAEVKKLFL